jgi:hypothetical protein
MLSLLRKLLEDPESERVLGLPGFHGNTAWEYESLVVPALLEDERGVRTLFWRCHVRLNLIDSRVEEGSLRVIGGSHAFSVW